MEEEEEEEEEEEAYETTSGIRMTYLPYPH